MSHGQEILYKKIVIYLILLKIKYKSLHKTIIFFPVLFKNYQEIDVMEMVYDWNLYVRIINLFLSLG